MVIHTCSGRLRHHAPVDPATSPMWLRPTPVDPATSPMWLRPTPSTRHLPDLGASRPVNLATSVKWSGCPVATDRDPHLVGEVAASRTARSRHLPEVARMPPDGGKWAVAPAQTGVRGNGPARDGGCGVHVAARLHPDTDRGRTVVRQRGGDPAAGALPVECGRGSHRPRRAGTDQPQHRHRARPVPPGVGRSAARTPTPAGPGRSVPRRPARPPPNRPSRCRRSTPTALCAPVPHRARTRSPRPSRVRDRGRSARRSARDRGRSCVRLRSERVD